MTLDVAISTYRPEGILKIEKMLPEKQEGVKYVVSWQEHENSEIPESLLHRDDVTIHRYDLKGLSNNRNNSISLCKGDIILIADDDLILEPDFSEKIKDTFYMNPDVDLGIFKVNFPNHKSYPNKEMDMKLPLPKNYYCSSVEIAFRRNKVSTLKFWDEMGLGNSRFECGEDELFLISAIKRGYHCKFFNKVIATHPAESTGAKVTPGILRGQGFIIGLIYPATSFLRIVLKSLRLSKRYNSSVFKHLKPLMSGVIRTVFYKSLIPPSSRW